MKKITTIALSLLGLAIAVMPAHAISIGMNYGDNIGLGNNDPITITTNVINLVLGLLGLIAVIIILIGGFKWMTASGNEDKVGEAKKMITQGLIGLVIILAAWGIARWVITVIAEQTNATVS
jgi:hypothetical protein